ncbi:ATP-binding protein [Flammeovirga sp. SJP92]|uniref:sensor histidine kinase n=1 Tax=Flammeovirga sp. SJP92 TaxID=1775430 RepID=UPI0007876ABA|nr:ATP-binding protein [Flammeovirga sp. SJP92]KXX71340.1 hypothetical protein AVL50_06950 [Flammeovirga sp. SJP92]
MKKLKHIVFNIGIQKGQSPTMIKKVRLLNELSLIAIGVIIIFFITSISINSPSKITIITGCLIPVFGIILLLNYYQKFHLSQIIYCVLSLIIIGGMAISLGEVFHFQYLFIPYLGLPLIIFEEVKTRKKNTFTLLGIMVFSYLRWHFHHFEPLISTTEEIQRYSQMVIDFINLGVSLVILSIFLSENKKYINSIRDKQEQLERKNYELKHFTYICSHNLSEPLRTTSSFLQFIKKETQGPNEKFDLYFNYIHDEMKIMDQMILSLLTFSKLSHEQEFKATNLNGILSEISNEMKDIITQKNVILTYHLFPEMDVAPDLIKLLFEHLITNSIKYQSEDAIPEINITYTECDTYWQFCIADNGIGITDQNQDKIFDMFTRLHLKSEYEGIGVGLAFCKKIVEMHQGSIWFKSKQNEGSQFYFTIKKDLLLEVKSTPTPTLHYKPSQFKNV